MTRAGAVDLAPLAERLGHAFADFGLLREALTHPSAHTGGRARGPNYQRLEFLGDRVLALAVAEMLIEAFARENEGALSRRLTQLVRAETCAEIAAELGLGDFVVLGDGEAASGGRLKTAILGDVAEAVIGAIFRDAGFAAARDFVQRHWSGRMLDTPRDLRDSKTTLQEWVQARGRPTPSYRLLERRGLDHAPEFVVMVEVPGLGGAEGAGRSKRAAEQAAAAAMLVAQGVVHEFSVMAEDAKMAEAKTRCGYVAIIGAPNAGKSTLVNAMVGTKVSIVSRKVQTTRALVRGIVMAGQSQIVLVDTPGIFAPKRRLDRAMVRTAWSGANDADLVALLIDSRRGFDPENAELATKVGTLPHPKLLVLNKIDLVAKEELLGLAAAGNALAKFDATFMIAATGGKGIGELTRFLADRAPEGPFLFDPDQVSDLPMRMLAAEVTREKLYDRLHEELPYASTVETDSWQKKPDGSVRIEQTIFVERDGQKKIVLGKGGATIKAISMAARRELIEMIESPVHLFLFVKVRENWGDEPERYREMGLDFPKE